MLTRDLHGSQSRRSRLGPGITLTFVRQMIRGHLVGSGVVTRLHFVPRQPRSGDWLELRQKTHTLRRIHSLDHYSIVGYATPPARAASFLPLRLTERIT